MPMTPVLGLSTTMVANLEQFTGWLNQQPLAATTLCNYRCKIRLFLRWLDGRPLTAQVLRAYGEYLRCQGIRPRTRRVVSAALRWYLQWLSDQHPEIELPPLAALQPGRLDPPRRPKIETNELTALWRATDLMPTHTPRARYLRGRAQALLALGCYAALRRSEVLSLCVTDIHLHTDPPAVYVRNGKGGESRWVPLNVDAVRVLREWLIIRAEWVALRHHMSPALFPVDRIRVLSEVGLTATLNDLCARAGITRRITWHALRRWCANQTARVAGPVTAQRLLGHSSLMTTLAYLHASVDEVVDAVTKLPRFNGHATSHGAQLARVP